MANPYQAIHERFQSAMASGPRFGIQYEINLMAEEYAQRCFDIYHLRKDIASGIFVDWPKDLQGKPLYYSDAQEHVMEYVPVLFTVLEENHLSSPLNPPYPQYPCSPQETHTWMADYRFWIGTFVAPKPIFGRHEKIDTIFFAEHPIRGYGSNMNTVKNHYKKALGQIARQLGKTYA